ncbi:MAG: Lrp/AsnC family transcriptional regulator [bacterium]
MADGTPVSPPSLDRVDRMLLRELAKDGRASHRDVAERTGLSLATVNRRIRQLEADKTIRGYAVLADAEQLGWTLTAVIGLRIEKGFVRAVHETIAKDPRIFGVYDVTGEWDGLVLVRLRGREDLDDLVKSTLSLPHIQRTSTMVVLKTVLESSVVNVPEEPPAKPAPRRARSATRGSSSIGRGRAAQP